MLACMLVKYGRNVGAVHRKDTPAMWVCITVECACRCRRCYLTTRWHRNARVAYSAHSLVVFLLSVLPSELLQNVAKKSGKRLAIRSDSKASKWHMCIIDSFVSVIFYQVCEGHIMSICCPFYFWLHWYNKNPSWVYFSNILHTAIGSLWKQQN